MLDTQMWVHYNPVRIVCAPLENLAQQVFAQHVLLVTTPGSVKRGVVQRVKKILPSSRVTVWEGVKPNPDLHDLDAATASLSNLGIDCVVGLGGGSALDAAKVLATTIASANVSPLLRVFRGMETPNWAPRMSLVAIPTTSGTGAEVTPFATVWDHETHKKHSLSGEFVYPDLALLDPTLTLSLGQEDTLYPALDAISHSLESLWNKNCTPISRAYALQALAISNYALPLVMKEPQNHKCREDLQIASMLSGLAISQTRTAIAHSISYPLTSHFGVPHGLACGFTLPVLLQKNLNNLATHPGEFGVLRATLSMLKSFNLHRRLAEFALAEQVRSLADDMFTPGRADNYNGQAFQSLDELLN